MQKNNNFFNYEYLKSKFKQKFYLTSFSLFFIWMLFFDSEDLITQYKLIKKYLYLKSQKKYYLKNIKKLKKYKKSFKNDKRIIEKIAREKYYMKKKNEDIYIIE